MKKRICGFLAALCALALLSGCGSNGEVIDYELVFVNNSESTVVEVVVDFADRLSGARRADNCPLKRGESLGFEAGEYPATVTVYDRLFEENSGQKELASITINSAPPEGERWYVTAQDGAGGLMLTADVRWQPGM